jgi:hypothetical protein
MPLVVIVTYGLMRDLHVVTIGTFMIDSVTLAVTFMVVCAGI